MKLWQALCLVTLLIALPIMGGCETKPKISPQEKYILDQITYYEDLYYTEVQKTEDAYNDYLDSYALYGPDSGRTKYSYRTYMSHRDKAISYEKKLESLYSQLAQYR